MVDYHTKYGYNFPMAQQVNLQACSPYSPHCPSNTEHQAGKLSPENTNFQVLASMSIDTSNYRYTLQALDRPSTAQCMALAIQVLFSC